MARDLAISSGRLLVMFDREYFIANLCAACGQTMHPAARRTDRQTVMVQA